jgi:Hydroxymethylglutaryl-CoA reductase
MLRTRGKRVVAEATIPAGLVRRVMHTSPSQMFRARQVSNLGGLLAGASGNANHPANAVAALFAATGQDIANVAESSAALVHTELLADGSYYYSITIPALIVATYGGGTGLPPSASAWNCSAATDRAGCASSPRSSRPPCSAARSRWARP